MTSNATRTVLITGCSDGGLGAALAIAFHNAGLHVYATTRNTAKMADLAARGIETLALDIESATSIAECVAKIPRLDILVNNAGIQFLMPLSDVDISAAKRLYDTNLWAQLAVTQAFIPHIITSKGIIINQTSIGAVVALPFQAIYNSSKAAFSMISDSMRLELAPFGVRVVDLRTGVVKSNIISNAQAAQDKGSLLPDKSIYNPARAEVEKVLRQEVFQGKGMPTEEWAKAVVGDILKKTPPSIIWRGGSSWLTWLATFLPHGMFDNTVKKAMGMDLVESALRK